MSKKFSILLKVSTELNDRLSKTLKLLNEQDQFVRKSKTSFIIEAIVEKLERGF